MRIYKRNCPADTKVSKKRGGGDASGTRAEIPLQPKVRQTVPLQPIEVHSRTDIHQQPVEESTLEHVDDQRRLYWTRLLARPVGLWRVEPMVDKAFWQGL